MANGDKGDQGETLLKGDAEAVFRQLQDAEKVGLLTGRDMWSAGGVPRLRIPALRMSDGPHGARGCCLRGVDGAALVPCETALAATFNEALIEEVGDLLGRECVQRGAHMLLGPTVNLQRSPLFGRHFECFSEDPFLSARAAVAYVRGVQRHVAACAKHFAGNDQENFRHSLNAVVDERTLREIYLAPFEAAVREAECEGLMCGYNRINGRFCTENEWLLNKVLRGEWGFKGVTVSDWFGNRNTVPALEAGLNVEMPGIEPRFYGGYLLDALRDGRVSRELLDERARPVLALTMRRAGQRPAAAAPEASNRAALLRRAAAQAVVLLKNEGRSLPLDLSRIRKIALIGPNAAGTVVQGGGSSRVRPRPCKSVLDAFREALPSGVELLHAPGCHPGQRGSDPELEALKMMGSSDATGQPASSLMARGADFSVAVGAAISSSDWARRWAMPVFRLFGWRHSDVEKMSQQMQEENLVVAPEVPSGRGQPLALLGLTVLVGGLALGGALASVATALVSTLLGLGLALTGLGQPRAESLLSHAEQLAAQADACVLVLGTDGHWESEGADMPHMGLPGLQDELVRRVAAAAAGPVVVVLNCGSPKTLPWLERVPAVLQAHFGGEEMAAAVVDTLLGKSCPAGRLPYTWPRSAADCPVLAAAAAQQALGRAGDVVYREGLAVGYRGYSREAYLPGGAALFAFGHGLSYASFALSRLRARQTSSSSDPSGLRVEVEVRVENVGTLAGAEVVQLYAEAGEGAVPLLAGFRRTAELSPGEQVDLLFVLGPRQLGESFDVAAGAWRLPAPGTTVRLHAGASLADLRETVGVAIA